MALTITDLPDYLHFNIKTKDIMGQIRSFSGYLTAHADDNLVNEVQDNFGSMLEDIEACTACKIESAELESVVGWTWISDKVPETLQYATVDNILVLNFERANPLKPGLKLNANVPLFAYTVGEASLDFPSAGSFNPGNVPVNDIKDYFQKRLTERYSGNGLLYNGFTFVNEDSGGISVPDIVDSQ